MAIAQWVRDRHFSSNQVPDLAKQDQTGVEEDSLCKVGQTNLQDDSIEKPRMRYFWGNPIVCHRRGADCSDADGRHLSRAFRFY